MRAIRAWACGLLSEAAWSAPGGLTSSTKQPRPRRSRGSSLRGMRAPMLRVVIGGASSSGARSCHARRGARAGGGRFAHLHERLERAVEALARRLDEAGADLTDAWLTVRHARVDLGQDSRLRDQ